MKILLVNSPCYKGNNPWYEGVDYLTCQILHGLVSLGHEVTDMYYTDFMDKCNESIIDYRTLYGNGFSYAFIFNDSRKNIDRENIEDKINEHYFDIVIFMISINDNENLLNLILDKYNFGEIFIVDGNDKQTVKNIIDNKKVLYFKRELTFVNGLFGTNNRLFPISYSIPKEKFQPKKYYKSNIFVNDCSYGYFYTDKKDYYTYNSEEDYYKHYNDSVFALTCRKGGYDCMRHYEIIASHCLPIFADFDQVPRTIMTTWPTDLQYHANSLFYEYKDNNNIFNDNYQLSRYFKLLDIFYDYAYNHLTTENVVNYLLSFC